jgi:hypothetical protein
MWESSHKWENIEMEFKERGSMVWTGFTWLRTGPVTGSCKHGTRERERRKKKKEKKRGFHRGPGNSWLGV